MPTGEVYIVDRWIGPTSFTDYKGNVYTSTTIMVEDKSPTVRGRKHDGWFEFTDDTLWGYDGRYIGVGWIGLTKAEMEKNFSVKLIPKPSGLITATKQLVESRVWFQGRLLSGVTACERHINCDSGDYQYEVCQVEDNRKVIASWHNGRFRLSDQSEYIVLNRNISEDLICGLSLAAVKKVGEVYAITKV